MCSMPGSTMLSVQLVRPVMSRASSLRRRGAPTSATVVGASVIATPSPAVGTDACDSRAADAHAAAASPTARTMFW